MNWTKPYCVYLVVGAFAAAVLAGCAPQRPYRRAPLPPGAASSAPPRSPAPRPNPAPPPPPAPAETVYRSLPRDAKIREQDIRPAIPPPIPSPKEVEPQPEIGEIHPPPDSSASLPPPLPDDSSLLAKITPGVTPQRAASLRLTDEGRKLLEAGEPAKALARLERTIVVDATNPYGYFYLAKAHYQLGRYSESLNFLAVAEARMGGEPFWLSEIHALRGENYRAQGLLRKAEASYTEALRLNSGNRTAAEALAQLHVENPSASR